MQNAMNILNNVQLLEMSKKSSKPKATPKGKWKITLHNDNVHTVDYVIGAIIDVCGHTELQATQCALITHRVGRCDIYVDSYTDCAAVANSMAALQLKVTMSLVPKTKKS